VLGRAAGRANQERTTGGGYLFLHTALDDHTRLAYTETLTDEKAATCAAFLRRAHACFTVHGIVVERVLTDNAWAYTKHTWRDVCAELGIQRRFTDGSPEPGGHRQTGKWSGFTAPCSTDGPTRSPTRQKPPANKPSPTGWTGWTTTDPTPESAAIHPPAAEPT
jgi:hypothetical protein